MIEAVDKLCQQCHARVSPAAQTAVCPACGGILLANPNPPDAQPAQVDHRGIVLPRRHAVGGVITPR